jgi:hypothetical protein
MKRNPVVFTTLFVLILLIFMVGNLYASARAGDSAQGSRPVAQGTEEYVLNSQTQADPLYLPLLIYETPPLPPEITVTPTPTNTPTVTPTSTSLPNEVVINHIEPGEYAEEFVRVKNRTTNTVDITGWTIKAKESGRTYTFPKFYLDPNDAVRVWTKTGYSQGMDLYWGLSTEVWDDDDDCGRLGDERDELQQWYCYSSGTPEAPTPTLAPIPDVIINHIEPGDDNNDYYAEYVRVKNRTLSTVNLKGWTIKSDSSKKIYTFPDFKLKPDAAVRVWTQPGTDGDEDLYWGAIEPVWDNKDDCARLGNDDDELADWYCYP